MAQVRLAGGGLDRHRGCAQVVMRAVHAASRRRFLVLLNCHVVAPFVISACAASCRAGRQTANCLPAPSRRDAAQARSEEHTSELQSRRDLVCRLLLEKKNISITRVTLCRYAHLTYRT